jgi:hypothetical protein
VEHSSFIFLEPGIVLVNSHILNDGESRWVPMFSPGIQRMDKLLHQLATIGNHEILQIMGR